MAASYRLPLTAAAQEPIAVGVPLPSAADAHPAKPSILRWPPGCTTFCVRTWLALSLALYLAFLFELTGASSAAVCVLILAQPSQGMVLSKALYRLLGTLIGCAAALTMSSAFPQDRTMLLAVFALFMAIQTAVGSLLRDFRSYAAILAGYTVAIISIANIDQPAAAFESAVNRVAAIVLGIVAMMLMNFLFAYEDSSRALMNKLRAATRDVLDIANTALEQRMAPTPQDCTAMAVRLMPLRSEISYATPEHADGVERATGARSALLGLFETISAIQAVGYGLSLVARPSPYILDLVKLVQKGLRLQNPDKVLPALDAHALLALREGSLSLAEAHVYDRANVLLRSFGEVRDGLLCLRTGRTPRRGVAIPLHQDHFAVFMHAVRVLVAVAATSTIGVVSGWNELAQAVLFTAVFVSLGGIQPDPRVMGNTALFGMPAVVLIGMIYSFFLLPNIQGFPLLMLALAPIVVLTCWMTAVGQPGVGMVVGVQAIVLMSPANVQTLDPNAFVSTATVLTFSGIVIWVTMRLLFPVDPAKRQLRLALSVGRFLRRALADEDKRPVPRLSKLYDCLDQFNTWQRGRPPNLARRKTVKRLADLGNLAFAVRRSWRALDAARPEVDSALDARARHVLPALAAGATLDLADRYLAAAHDKEARAALRLIHAAAALYGVAILTTSEKRLLARIRLLGRPR